MDKRTGWLAQLKPGDFVYFEDLFRRIQRSEILHITASGRIGCGSMHFDPKGRRISSERSFSHYIYIQEPTPRLLERYERQQLVAGMQAWVEGAGLNTASMEKMRAVYAAMTLEESKLASGEGNA